ncbi:sensor histidine kinase [Chryseobacterium limigenitum]|uniref:Signal transduction histidine kinase n=1 Tax=Chryseobacterium limigenitum TaxID=1612149 RepID=A0A1K2IXW2_9FLAO|nr:ATP-binding protein [Chryseobacterium limigenitum]SFZ97032.1 Signal transduction histidine kinase [Chryseobacterium limigenitum]
MKIILYLFILSFAITLGYGQENSFEEIKSLQKNVKKEKGLEKIKILTSLDYEYIQSGEVALFLKNHARLRKELLNYNGNCDYYWIRFYEQSIAYYGRNDDYKMVFSFLQKIINIQTNERDALNLKGNAFQNMVSILILFEQYDEAQVYAKKAEKLLSNPIDDLSQSKINLLNGDVNRALYENAKLIKSKNSLSYYNTAKEYYKKSYKFLVKARFSKNNKFQQNTYYQSLYVMASKLYSLGLKKEAEDIFSQFDPLFEKKEISLRNYLFAKWYEFDIKSKDSAITNPEALLKKIEAVIALNDTTNFRDQNTYLMSYKARVLKQMKLYHLAEVEYKKVYDRLEILGNDIPTKLEITEALGAIFETLGQEKRALEYKNKTIELSKLISKTNSPYASQKAEIVILLERQRQQREIELEKLKTAKNRNYLIIASLSLVVIMAIALLLLLNNRNLKTKQKLLISQVNYNKEMALNSELENIFQIKMELSNRKVISENKKNIAKNLHDDLASSLAATNHFIQDKAMIAINEKDKSNFLAIKEEVNQLYEETRKYIYNLYNYDDQAFSLSRYLINLLKNNQAINNINFNVKADFDEMDEKLNTEQQNQLFRIIKEAVTNSLKYSNAKEITIKVDFTSNECLFLVQDDGIGFSPHTITGIGLKNIEERIDSLENGRITIHSDLNKGTIIRGQFSLRAG